MMSEPDAVSDSASRAGAENGAEPVTDILLLSDVGVHSLASLLAPAGLSVLQGEEGALIPGSHWGEPEAGLVGGELHVRLDTPVHSALHEAGHWLLMDEVRRNNLHTDAGGTADEENAVCLLQILLAEDLPPMTMARMFDDMDAWGYSFRLGSTRAWFDQDADDARAALAHRLHRFALAEPVMQRIRGACST